MPRDDDEFSCLRARADDFILDVAERDPARVARVIADVCERLAAERHLSWAELEAAVEVLLLEWQERLSNRSAIRTETLINRADRAVPESLRARERLNRG